MKIITDQELMMIQGGEIAWGMVALILTGLTAFAIGVLDGFKRPLKCNR